MLPASLLLVFGTAGLFVSIVFSGGPGLPAGTRILLHSPMPWPFVLALAAGGLLGILALWRRPSIGKGAVVAIELLAVAAGLRFFLGMNALPEHELSVRVGDPFPSYALQDQDGRLHSGPADASDKAKLFIFYRGDW
jgi:hypothetical protein